MQHVFVPNKIICLSECFWCLIMTQVPYKYWLILLLSNVNDYFIKLPNMCSVNMCIICTWCNIFVPRCTCTEDKNIVVFILKPHKYFSTGYSGKFIGPFEQAFFPLVPLVPSLVAVRFIDHLPLSWCRRPIVGIADSKM